MRAVAVYQVPDPDDQGFESMDDFLLVNSVGYYEFDEPHGATHRKYGRKDFYLSYNHAGEMAVRFGSVTHIIEGGDVFIYKPRAEQWYGQGNNQGFANYWIHFTGYGVSELLTTCNLWNNDVYSITVDDHIPELFRRIMNEIAAKQPNFRQMSSVLLEELLLTISRKVSMSMESRQVSPNEASMMRSIKLINRRYSEKISVVELAQSAGFSTSRYSALFKVLTGLSPQHYLIQLRLKKATELLNHTNLSIRQVAALVGFEDQLYFSKLFKRHFELSPGQYRAKQRMLVNTTVDEGDSVNV